MSLNVIPFIMLCLLTLFLLFFEVSTENIPNGCEKIPGNLKQLDASGGEVYGVNSIGSVYRLSNNDWVHIPGQLNHVTVGPAGVWGIGDQNIIYKVQNNTWPNVTGFHLKQVDAGIANYLSGVDQNNNVFCMKLSCPKSLSIYITLFQIFPIIMKYYTCGPLGCWAVATNNLMYYRSNSNSTFCQGTDWLWMNIYNVVMVEVGTDGSVYTLNIFGDVYKRDGISSNVPAGTGWTKVNTCCQFSHLSYDDRILWLLGTNGDIFKCPQN